MALMKQNGAIEFDQKWENETAELGGTGNIWLFSIYTIYDLKKFTIRNNDMNT